MPTGRASRFPSARQRREMERFWADDKMREYLDAQPWETDTSYDVPDLGGYSIKPGTIYIDRDAAKDDKLIPWLDALTLYDPGEELIGHEVAEKAIMDVWGYDYEAAHEIATALEHDVVTRDLGGDWDKYQKLLAPIIKRAETDAIEHPPRDLDCRPYYQDPDAQDIKILKKLRDRHVPDAFHQDGEFHPSKIGAREAPDGKFYINDFGNPGKFLRVE